MRATENIEKMYNIIKNAHNVGINHIETAASYGDAEILIGSALEKLTQKRKDTKNLLDHYN